MAHKVKILLTEFVTHDVKRLIVEKPIGYEVSAGDSAMFCINTPKWRDQKRAFSFTSTEYDHVLEFMIKIYPDHKGVTDALADLVPGDGLILDDPFSSIDYKGKGVFIAGGAGITPFLSILRVLHQKNEIEGHTLVFSNKTAKDIIAEHELEALFKDNPKSLINTLSREVRKGYESGHINRVLLEKCISNVDQFFYICGTPVFKNSVVKILKAMNVESEKIVM